MTVMLRKLADATATAGFGAALAHALARRGATITLSGELGAGKTTLVRGLIQALGYSGRVRSPTYTLVEPYEFDGYRVFHVDLYRIAGESESAPLGLEEVDEQRDLLIVEWPERLAGRFARPDIAIALSYDNGGRLASSEGRTTLGNTILCALESVD